MYLQKIYDLAARDYRVRYAITVILRDRVTNEGAFNCCFEMGDEDEVKRMILRRGLRNKKLRRALERSHLVNITHWLARYPDLAEAYCAEIPTMSEQEKS
ncbi:hypothetical protein ACFPT7_08070 [Acidicapsa dinghuensis]|uniref:Uncharacterized protein n=1 Tax=Acidicapsa dinghuensis TaxID=2218256 RepID=A0ABW1EEF6_9BACT|nr:hypothetical protein [Acidicapsa dinghuensis]